MSCIEQNVFERGGGVRGRSLGGIYQLRMGIGKPKEARSLPVLYSCEEITLRSCGCGENEILGGSYPLRINLIYSLGGCYCFHVPSATPKYLSQANLVYNFFLQ